MPLQRADHALGEKRIQAQGHAGGAEHLVAGRGQRQGQTHATVLGAASQSQPAARAKRSVRFVEGLRRSDDAVFEPCALLVRDAMGRHDAFLESSCRFLKDRVAGSVFEYRMRAGAPEPVDADHLVEAEPDVIERGTVRHGSCSGGWAGQRRVVERGGRAVYHRDRDETPLRHNRREQD